MEGAVVLLLLFLLSLLFFSFLQLRKKKSQLPPGPSPWLFLGNFLQKDILPLNKSYRKLMEKYGPIFTVWLGPQPVVVLCGYKVVKDALVGHAEEFGGRPSIPINDRVTKGHGILGKDEITWREMRRFTLSTLRNFGMGKTSMADRLQEEASCLVEEIATTQGQIFDPTQKLTYAVTNVICSIMFGSRFSYDDKVFLEFQGIMKDYLNFYMSLPGLVYSSIPSITNWLPGPHQKLFKNCDKICDFIREKVESHKLSLDPQNPSDYIDCFLLMSQKEQKSEKKIYSTENLVMTVFNLFTAGTETTTTTLVYSLLMMCKYPHIQEKVHQELDNVVGINRLPSLEDRSQLHFTNAVMYEIQRYQNESNEGLPRLMTQDTKFRGVTIPQGTFICPLLASVMYDPLEWKTPDKFNPSHFLDENGHFQKRDAHMLFLAGKRACPGEALARMEIYFFFTIFLQNFTFQFATDPDKIEVASLSMNYRHIDWYRQIRAFRRPR